MNKQLTLGAGFEKYAKTTKRAQFLDDMDRIIVNGNNWGATDVATDNRLRFYWYQATLLDFVYRPACQTYPPK